MAESKETRQLPERRYPPARRAKRRNAGAFGGSGGMVSTLVPIGGGALAGTGTALAVARAMKDTRPVWIAGGTALLGAGVAAAGLATKSQTVAKVGAGVLAAGAVLTLLDVLNNADAEKAKREQEQKQIQDQAKQAAQHGQQQQHRQAGYVTEEQMHEAVRKAVADQHREILDSVGEIRNALATLSALPPHVTSHVDLATTSIAQPEHEEMIAPPGAHPDDHRNALPEYETFIPPPGAHPDDHRNASVEEAEVIEEIHHHRNEHPHSAEYADAA